MCLSVYYVYFHHLRANLIQYTLNGYGYRAFIHAYIWTISKFAHSEAAAAAASYINIYVLAKYYFIQESERPHCVVVIAIVIVIIWSSGADLSSNWECMIWMREIYLSIVIGSVFYYVYGLFCTRSKAKTRTMLWRRTIDSMWMSARVFYCCKMKYIEQSSKRAFWTW